MMLPPVLVYVDVVRDRDRHLLLLVPVYLAYQFLIIVGVVAFPFLALSWLLRRRLPRLRGGGGKFVEILRFASLLRELRIEVDADGLRVKVAVY